jgi:hypothetical protein
MSKYAIFTWSEEGPIKSWHRMRAAQEHNSREVPQDHCDPNGPGPIHLIGEGELVDELRERLREHGLDPDRIRKGGVIAYEGVLTASRAFFEEGSAEDRQARLDAWAAAQVEFVLDRYDTRRIVSLVLHLDELTPHMHLVVLPLELKADGRRGDEIERWSLVGRTISGPGQYQKLQDDYAAAMEPFGLQRGIAGSGRKKRPVKEYLEELAAKEAAAEEAKRAADREAQKYRRMSAVCEETLAALRVDRQYLQEHVKAAKADRERAAKDRTVAADELESAAVARKVADREAAVVRSRRFAVEDDLEQLDAVFGALNNVLGKTLRVRDAFAGIPQDLVPPAVREALRELVGLHQSATTLKLPHVDLPTVQHRLFEQRQAGLGR